MGLRRGSYPAGTLLRSREVVAVEWFWWVAIILAVIIILPDPIGMAIGWALDKWFNEFEEEGVDVSVERRAELEKAGELKELQTKDEN
jgi:hypothetical protein